VGWFWIWPALVLIGVILLGYLAYRLTQNRGGSPGEKVGSRVSAHQILDERYARGEIDDEEYRRRRDELQ
jgi:putative membrane protein